MKAKVVTDTVEQYVWSGIGTAQQIASISELCIYGSQMFSGVKVVYISATNIPIL